MLKICVLVVCMLYYHEKQFFKNVSQSLTPFFDSGLLTAVEPHLSVFPSCLTSTQAG